MATSVIRNFIAKALFKKKGAIANNKAVDFSANALEQRIKNVGIDPNAITSENELNQILSAVKKAEDAAFSQQFGNMLGGSKFDRQGEVFDMTGKKLDSSRGIMGGTQIDEKSLKEGLMKTDNPFSDLVKTTDQKPKSLKEREAEVLAAMEKNNKEAVQRIKNRKMIDDAIDNASPGFAGDRKYDAQLVADDLAEKRFGKDFYDLDEIDQMNIYDEAYQGLSKQRFDQKQVQRESLEDFVDDAGGVNPDDPRGIDDFIPDPEDMATGGRAGFKGGSYDYNSFDHKINELKAAYKRYKKGSATGGRGGIMTFEQFAPMFAAENFATGGRAGFKGGMGKGFLEFMKKFRVKQSGDDLKDFLSKRQFMKDIVGNTQKNERARELAMLKENLDNYRKRYKGYQFPSDDQIKTDLEKIIQPILNKDRKLNATGGRIGYADGTPDKKSLLDMIDIQASGSKSGKQQIMGAPEGITIDTESINAIIKADIPITQKIDLLSKYQYGKNRDRIDYKDQEIKMDEGGYTDRDIGFGYNLGGDGISGSVMRDLRTGDDEFKINFKKSFAEGGRIGLKAGMTKRAFMKLMGGIGATIGAAKSGIFTGLGKGATKQAAKEVVKSTTTPPPYFFELANKIKSFGKPDKVTYADRVEIHRYRGKNGDEYELIEDLNTGDMKIQKDKTGVGTYGDKSFDTIEDRTEMVFKKGQADETTKGKPADEYEEYKVEFDSDGTAADATELDAAVQKEIIEEATGNAPSIKKAGGGIARMLGE